MEISDPRARRAAALAEERRRLERVRARRERGRRDSVWQEFQVGSEQIPELRAVVEAAVEEAGESGGQAAQSLRDLLESRVCPSAPHLLLQLFQALPADSAVGYLKRLHGIGVPALKRWTGMGCMLSPDAENPYKDLQELPSLSLDFGLWRDSELLRQGRRLRSLPRFVERAPLALVDDLLDLGAKLPLSGEERADHQENLYLLGRRAPAELTDEQLGELGWEQERWRRRLFEDPSLEVPEDAPEQIRDLAAVAEGDQRALKRVSEVLDDRSRQLVHHLLDAVRRSAQPPRALLKDAALWPVLESLCSGTVDTPTDDPAQFFAWRDLRAAHRELLEVNPAAYDRISPHLDAGEPWVREEAVGMKVYLDLRFSENGDPQALHVALESLLALENRSAATDANISWLRSRIRTDRNSRNPIFNPYLELGVPHGAPQQVWREAWRGLRKKLQGRPMELSDINLARDFIRDIEAAAELRDQPMYVLPLFPERLFPAPRIPLQFVLEAQPLPRRTASVSERDRERIRHKAVTSLLGYAVEKGRHEQL